MNENYVATEVIFAAFVDLIHQSWGYKALKKDRDNAADFIASGDYEPWCDIAGVDSNAVYRHAVELARQFRGWQEHPECMHRPVIEIPYEKWRTPDKMNQGERR